MSLDMNKHLLDALIKMTSRLVRLLDVSKKKDANLKTILLEIQTELICAESHIKKEQNKLIEVIFDPLVPTQLPAGIVKMKLKADAPDVFFLN